MPVIKEYPDCEFLKECFEYRDGKLFWLNRPRCHFSTEKGWKIFNTSFAGKEAGCLAITKSGPRWVIGLNGFGSLYRNVLVWLMHNGSYDQSLEVDHKNTDSSDDDIGNLRLCTQTQNHVNTTIRKNKKHSKFNGVQRSESGNRWRADLCVNGKYKYIGTFDTEEEAGNAYAVAARKYFGEFANPGNLL